MAVLTEQEQTAARLLLSALIGFLAAEAPMDEKSFPLMMELLNCMEGEQAVSYTHLGSAAKKLLQDLQSRNARMFLLTFLVLNTADNPRQLGAAEHGLLAEQVGFGLGLKGGFQHTGTGAADALL